MNDVLLPEKIKEEAADTISDTHPKNLKSKLNELDKNKEKSIPVINDENKAEEIKLIKQQQLIETMKQHGEEQKELMQEQKEILDEIFKNKNDMNIDKPKPEIKPTEPNADENIKQQQLIETIKQHGEEQKELMKEQKEILHEIKELKQNKDADNNEAKKIAVESIKQIADMAIKSIGGVTDKPVGEPKEDQKAEHFEKLTNEAVKEIAKKAVETIEAIQEIKDNPEAVIPAVHPSNTKIENAKAVEKPSVIIPNQVDTKPYPVINQNLQNNQNEGKHQVNIKRELLSNNAPDSEVKQSVEQAIRPVAPTIAAASVAIEKNVPYNVASINNVAEKEIQKVIKVEPHSHSPDEPQSYKLGEDTHIKKEDNKLIQNVPLAVAMNDKAKLESRVETNAKSNIAELKQNIIGNNNSLKQRIALKEENIISKVEHLVREKRDVVDCTHTVTLDPADRNLCKTLNLLPLDNDFLPKVDLNDLMSKMALNLDLRHISRSLKNYDDTESKR